jgi:hypothetical protein
MDSEGRENPHIIGRYVVSPASRITFFGPERARNHLPRVCGSIGQQSQLARVNKLKRTPAIVQNQARQGMAKDTSQAQALDTARHGQIDFACGMTPIDIVIDAGREVSRASKSHCRIDLPRVIRLDLKPALRYPQCTVQLSGPPKAGHFQSQVEPGKGQKINDCTVPWFLSRNPSQQNPPLQRGREALWQPDIVQVASPTVASPEGSTARQTRSCRGSMFGGNTPAPAALSAQVCCLSWQLQPRVVRAPETPKICQNDRRHETTS